MDEMAVWQAAELCEVRWVAHAHGRVGLLLCRGEVGLGLALRLWLCHPLPPRTPRGSLDGTLGWVRATLAGGFLQWGTVLSRGKGPP